MSTVSQDKGLMLCKTDADPLLYDGELISVIVPVYNVEKYIRRCVESITSQSYNNLEILLINDASPDDCPQICDELAKQDDRIRVIHLSKNQGLSVARNTGIAESSGEYLAFIDSDDYVLPDYIARLYGLLKKYSAEISITGYIKEYATSGKRERKKNDDPYTLIMGRHEAMETFLYQRHFITSAWGRMFHRSLFGDIEFPPGRLHEDVCVMYKLLDKTSCVVYRSTKDYVYLQRPNSIVYTKQRERERDSFEFSEEMRIFIESEYPDLKDAVLSKYFSTSILILMDIPLRNIYREDHAAIISKIKEYRKSVLMNPKARIANRGCAFLSYFGIWVLKLLLAILS